MNDVSDEILEVVDEHDVVIGLQKRGVIHRDRLMHRAAHVLLTNSQGELCLQQRAMSKDVFPGFWDSSAAGHVEPGESYAACAGRELAEELGVPGSPALRRLGKLRAGEGTGQEHVEVFAVSYDGPLRPSDAEVTAIAWLPVEVFASRVADGDPELTPSLRLIWREFGELLQTR